MSSIVIVGGGLVGLATALQISAQNASREVMLIEPVPFSHSVGERLDIRSSAIAHGSLGLLQRIGVDLSDCAEPIRKIHVSAESHLSSLSFDAASAGFELFGRVVDNSVLLARMLEQAQAMSNLTIEHGLSVEKINVEVSGYKLAFDHGEACTAELLVLADGANSALARSLGVTMEAYPFKQHALVFNVELAATHEGIARERFHEGAPLAMLPLTENRYAVVWCMSPEDADRVLALSDEDFIERLIKATDYRVSDIVEVGRRVSFPLTQYRSQEIIRRGLAIIGNAAHTLHPVAGQGFNLCLRDGQALAESITKAQKLFDLDYLELWQARCLGDQDLTVKASRMLVDSFSYSSGAMLRSILMQLFAANPGIERAVLDRASGRAFGQTQ